jgi:hypothetical protein
VLSTERLRPWRVGRSRCCHAPLAACVWLAVWLCGWRRAAHERRAAGRAAAASGAGAAAAAGAAVQRAAAPGALRGRQQGAPALGTCPLGTSTSKRWILRYAASMPPWLLMTTWQLCMCSGSGPTSCGRQRRRRRAPVAVLAAAQDRQPPAALPERLLLAQPRSLAHAMHISTPTPRPLPLDPPGSPPATATPPCAWPVRCTAASGAPRVSLLFGGTPAGSCR